MGPFTKSGFKRKNKTPKTKKHPPGSAFFNKKRVFATVLLSLFFERCFTCVAFSLFSVMTSAKVRRSDDMSGVFPPTAATQMLSRPQRGRDKHLPVSRLTKAILNNQYYTTSVPAAWLPCRQDNSVVMEIPNFTAHITVSDTRMQT